MFRSGALILFLSFITGGVFAQAIHDPKDLQQLKAYRNSADEYSARNVYRFGLEQLRQYDNTLNNLYAAEKSDTLQAISNAYQQANAGFQAESAGLKNKKETLLKNKEQYDSSYSKLLTRAGMLLASLFVLYGAFLFIWNKRLRDTRDETLLYTGKLEHTRALAAEGDALIATASGQFPVLQKLKEHVKEVSLQAERFQMLISPETKNGSWRDLVMHTKKINQQVQAEEEKNTAIVDFSATITEEKTKTDINTLCIHYFDLVKEGLKTEDDMPPVTATTDLEKNLPQIKVVPTAIGHLLTHVLTNAMQSVQAKAGKNIKGYEPKVALSTRILPRFLQIRIHDNGDGIEDRYIHKIMDPFFTMKQPTDAGLGLYVSDLIMKNHQGEIKIESDKTRGTDIYLKFYLH